MPPELLKYNESLMKNTPTQPTHRPMIVKYVDSLHSGIQSQSLARYAIGSVLRGTKHIYDGDRRLSLKRGDLFYLGIGHHYIEHTPDDNGQPYEEILFYYTPAELQRILLHLNIVYGLNITNNHTCDICRNRSYVVMPGWNATRNFFANMAAYLRDEEFRPDETAESIKMTELVYLLVSHEECCIKSKILSTVDTAKENFEQTIYDHIFKDVSIEELARRTNRSLTSFKKEFRRHFQMPPHKWFIRQRLMHSRLLLISTSKSISEIGNECTFPNTSHFIKLFKKEYRMTPAAYRFRHSAGDNPPHGSSDTAGETECEAGDRTDKQAARLQSAPQTGLNGVLDSVAGEFGGLEIAGLN